MSKTKQLVEKIKNLIIESDWKIWYKQYKEEYV